MKIRYKIKYGSRKSFEEDLQVSELELISSSDFALYDVELVADTLEAEDYTIYIYNVANDEWDDASKLSVKRRPIQFKDIVQWSNEVKPYLIEEN